VDKYPPVEWVLEEEMTIGYFLARYEDEYRSILQNKLSVPVNPLGGLYFWHWRKEVDYDKGTVRLYRQEFK